MVDSVEAPREAARELQAGVQQAATHHAIVRGKTVFAPIMLLVGIWLIDELQAWYLGKADAEGWVHTSVLRQLLNRLYRERDHLARRKEQGQRTAYDYAVERDQKALAWAIRALVRHTPAQDKAQPEPPRKPQAPRRRLSPEERERYKGRPSWNGQPKRGWTGIELPP